MSNSEYNRMINRNTFVCWAIIASVLVLAYIVEIFKGLREPSYVILFSLITILPILITMFINYKQKGSLTNIKYYFSIGYMLFYTFSLLTTRNILGFIYIVPMISILLVYCDKKLTFSVFSYVTLLNLFVIFRDYNLLMDNGGVFTMELKEMISYWEIQVAALVLSGVFLYKSTALIKYRDDIMEELQYDIYKDPLTSLYNIRFLEENINKRFNYKLNNELSIAFIDVDDFKKFNTLYGHKFGDKVLIEVCNLIHAEMSVKKRNYGFRVGGDEFVIISCSLNNDEFIEMIDKIRGEIENMKLKYENKDVGVCVSIGVANKNVDKCSTFLDLYNLADSRNSTAKKSGKNVVVSHTNDQD